MNGNCDHGVSLTATCQACKVSCRDTGLVGAVGECFARVTAEKRDDLLVRLIDGLYDIFKYPSE